MVNIKVVGGVFTDFTVKYQSYAFIALLLLLWLGDVGNLEPAVQLKKIESKSCSQMSKSIAVR